MPGNDSQRNAPESNKTRCETDLCCEKGKTDSYDGRQHNEEEVQADHTPGHGANLSYAAAVSPRGEPQGPDPASPNVTRRRSST
jgi:hypothetical protein